MASKLADIFKAIFMFYIFGTGIYYYFGFGKRSYEKEQERKERVRKYGFILIASSVVALLSGLYLFIDAISR